MQRLCWSPDGEELLLRDDSRLLALDIASGASREVTALSNENIQGADWSSGDVVLFGVVGEGIYRVSALGGDAEKIVIPEPSRFESPVASSWGWIARRSIREPG